MTQHLTVPGRALFVLCFGAPLSCARPQYVSDEHAALEAPVTLGQGDTGKPSLSELAAAQPSSSAEPDQAAPTFDPVASPDPEPILATAAYQVGLRYCQQTVHVVSSRRMEFDKPVILPTRMGRFAVELWIGRELLERARFDFPLLGAEATDVVDGRDGTAQPLGFSAKADVSRVVEVAERTRATQAWVVDRATGQRWTLEWPPQPKEPDSDSGLAACPDSPEPSSK